MFCVILCNLDTVNIWLFGFSGDVVLDWSPLFSVVKVTPDNSEYIVSNTVTVTISLRYHGQKVYLL